MFPRSGVSGSIWQGGWGWGAPYPERRSNTSTEGRWILVCIPTSADRVAGPAGCREQLQQRCRKRREPQQKLKKAAYVQAMCKSYVRGYVRAMCGPSAAIGPVLGLRPPFLTLPPGCQTCSPLLALFCLLSSPCFSSAGSPLPALLRLLSSVYFPLRPFLSKLSSTSPHLQQQTWAHRSLLKRVR